MQCALAVAPSLTLSLPPHQSAAQAVTTRVSQRLTGWPRVCIWARDASTPAEHGTAAIWAASSTFTSLTVLHQAPGHKLTEIYWVHLIASYLHQVIDHTLLAPSLPVSCELAAASAAFRNQNALTAAQP